MMDGSRLLPTSTLKICEEPQAAHVSEDFPGAINDILQSDVSTPRILPALGADTTCRMESIHYFLG